MRARGVTTREELAPAYAHWVLENLARGAEPAQLVNALETRGVRAATARREVSSLAASPAVSLLRQRDRDARAHELLARLARSLWTTDPHSREVERRAGVSAEEFFARYYAGNAPVVLTDWARDWPALARWNPAFLRERFGDVEVRAAVGRDADPDYDMHTAALSKSMPMRAFVDLVLAAGESNDLYMVANNRNIERDALAALWDDAPFRDDAFDPAKRPGSAAFWFGPGGTVTPLHHDTCNILFVQVYGQKRFRMLPPSETWLWRGARGVYAQADPERVEDPRFPEWAQATVKDVTLGPGDALFIPVGWWHHVRSLGVSISMAATNFRARNSFDWFRPAQGPGPHGAP